MNTDKLIELGHLYKQLNNWHKLRLNVFIVGCMFQNFLATPTLTGLKGAFQTLIVLIGAEIGAAAGWLIFAGLLLITIANANILR